MKYDVIQDVSDLTTMPKNQICELLNKIATISCHDVKEQMDEGVCETELDLYIGKLYVLVQDEQIKYKFIPSKKFENMMSKTVQTGESPLIRTIETTLRDRLQSTYKDLF